MDKPVVLVSACLLGAYCRYNGQCQTIAELDALMARAQLLPLCPETLGGLPTPRLPSECRGERVFASDGRDVTAAYRRGADETLRLARLFGARAALLKERSPSCGAGVIHNGRFDGGLVSGDGVTAALLRQNGIAVFGETRVAELMQFMEEVR